MTGTGGLLTVEGRGAGGIIARSTNVQAGGVTGALFVTAFYHTHI